jgi:hypothetical protein
VRDKETCLPAWRPERQEPKKRLAMAPCAATEPTLNCCLSSSMTSPVLSSKEEDSSFEALLCFFAALTGVSCVRADLQYTYIHYMCVYIYTRARAHTHTHTHTQADLFICEPDARGATEEDPLLSSDTDVMSSRFVGPWRAVMYWRRSSSLESLTGEMRRPARTFLSVRVLTVGVARSMSMCLRVCVYVHVIMHVDTYLHA